MSTEQMPNLPAPYRVEQPTHSEPFGLWTARQVLDYSERRVAAEREACAALCEALDPHDPATGITLDIVPPGPRDFAAAIRARSGAQDEGTT